MKRFGRVLLIGSLTLLMLALAAFAMFAILENTRPLDQDRLLVPDIR